MLMIQLLTLVKIKLYMTFHRAWEIKMTSYRFVNDSLEEDGTVYLS